MFVCVETHSSVSLYISWGQTQCSLNRAAGRAAVLTALSRYILTAESLLEHKLVECLISRVELEFVASIRSSLCHEAEPGLFFTSWHFVPDSACLTCLHTAMIKGCLSVQHIKTNQQLFPLVVSVRFRFGDLSLKFCLHLNIVELLTAVRSSAATCLWTVSRLHYSYSS